MTTAPEGTGHSEDAGLRRAAPRLVVLAGPTAVGKGTVAAYVRRHHPAVWLSVSMTTREPRPGEVDGVHYHFVDDQEFERLREAGEFLEWAVVHGRAKYGTPRGPVERTLAHGRPALLEIDLAGARQVRAAMPDAYFVFLAPPSWEDLVERLIGRGTETEAEQQVRLQTARTELAAVSEFDAQIVNDDVSRAGEELVSLMFDPRSTDADEAPEGDVDSPGLRTETTRTHLT